MSKRILIAANALLVFAFVGTLAMFAHAADMTPPVISGVGVSDVTHATSTISWTTDEPSDTQADYGTTTAYGFSSALQTATTTAHTVNLSGLTASTTYHFIVKSRDEAGNLATFTDQSFTTFSAPATTTPSVVGIITVGVKVEPKTINGRSKGRWVEVRVMFPEGYDARDADMSSVKLNGTLSPERVKVKAKKDKKHDDEDRDRESRLHLKFSRRAVIDLLAQGTTTTSTGSTSSPQAATSTNPIFTPKQIIISGVISGQTFGGSTMVRFRQATDLPDGTILRSSDGQEVYIIKDGKRRHIPSARAFEDMGLKWDNINIMSQAVVDAYADSSLIRSSDNPAVYIVSGGKKRHVADPSAFEAQGLDWSDVTVISPRELAYYSTVSNVTLLRASGDAKVYFISGGKRQWIPSESVFNRRGFKWEDIVTVDETERDNYQDGGNLQ
ncbi:hypothetical protein HY250_01410 [Candidatus Azambacteria bacterium]|nr:hypothetical protein [Candidatus Azambacteria bacterium]MBI3685038.1 hypothetical protein [Candidatus Azambacteria bacterium]